MNGHHTSTVDSDAFYRLIDPQVDFLSTAPLVPVIAFVINEPWTPVYRYFRFRQGVYLICDPTDYRPINVGMTRNGTTGGLGDRLCSQANWLQPCGRFENKSNVLDRLRVIRGQHLPADYLWDHFVRILEEKDLNIRGAIERRASELLKPEADTTKNGI
jgi:hypothetical protein